MLLWSVAAVAAVLVGLAWFYPSGDYLYVPNTAIPVAAKVKVEGEKPAVQGKGAIYYVDVSVRQATWAERLVPLLRPDGATLVPREQVVPAGSSFEDRHEEGLREMARSEEVAAAVALKQAGYKVIANPRGALVEAHCRTSCPIRKPRRGGRSDPVHQKGSRKKEPSLEDHCP